jgi:hypothetical protein
MKCPKCGHEFPAKNQAKGGKSRWKGMTKKQRSEEMKRVRAKGISSANCVSAAPSGISNSATPTNSHENKK